MKTFLAELDTPGGHMILCFVLILTGAIFTSLKIPKGEDLIMGGVGVMFGAMRGRNGKDSNPPKS